LTRRRKALWAVLILLTAILIAAYASFPVVVRRLLTGPTLPAGSTVADAALRP